MFWDNFFSLCQQRKTTPNAVCKELGFSNATATHWKNGKKPTSEKISQIATYFNVSVDELLSKEKPQTVKYDSGLSENSILICRGGDTKELHFTKEQIETIEKMLESISSDDSL